MEEPWVHAAQRLEQAVVGSITHFLCYPCLLPPAWSRSATSQNSSVKRASDFVIFYNIKKKGGRGGLNGQMGIYRRTVWFCFPLIWLFLHFSATSEILFLWQCHFFYSKTCKTEEVQTLNWSLQGLQVEPSTTAWYFWLVCLSDSHHYEGKEKIFQRKDVSISYLIFSVISKL